MFRLIVVLAALACTLAFAPAMKPVSTGNMQMSMDAMKSRVGKMLGVAVMGAALAGPMAPPQPAVADGAVSASTIYRARNYYGARIKNLAKDVSTSNFAAFEDKKVINAFERFISASNAQKSTIAKERKAAEEAIQANIYSAVKSKDANKLRAAYNEFIKVADLTDDYKPGELGQTDSSGYSPTWGTDRQYIYQR